MTQIMPQKAKVVGVGIIVTYTYNHRNILRCIAGLIIIIFLNLDKITWANPISLVFIKLEKNK